VKNRRARDLAIGDDGFVWRRLLDASSPRARLIRRNKTKRNEKKLTISHLWSRRRSHHHRSRGLVALSRARPRRPPHPSRSVHIRDEVPLQPRTIIARLSRGNFETSSTRAGEPIASDVPRGRARPPDPLRAVATVLQPFDVPVEGYTSSHWWRVTGRSGGGWVTMDHGSTDRLHTSPFL